MSKGERVDQGSVLVFGDCMRLCLPDYAELLFTVQAEGLNAERAWQDNAIRIEHLQKVALAHGVAATDMQCSILALQPVFPAMHASAATAGLASAPSPAMPHTGEGTHKVGYRVSSVVKIAVGEIHRVGELIENSTRAGFVLSGGPIFRVRADSPSRRQALETAIAAARSKAEILASASGQQLGPPLNITEQAYGDMPAIPQGAGEAAVGARVSVLYSLR